MKIHTTNSADTFIEIADDCTASNGVVPPIKKHKTVANIQYEMIRNNPYMFSSDDVIFQVYADKNGLTAQEYKQGRESFFSKGQACLRASPLTKRYGWGVHHDENGKIAIYGCETEEYRRFLNDENINKAKALKSRK